MVDGSGFGDAVNKAYQGTQVIGFARVSLEALQDDPESSKPTKGVDEVDQKI